MSEVASEVTDIAEQLEVVEMTEEAGEKASSSSDGVDVASSLSGRWRETLPSILVVVGSILFGNFFNELQFWKHGHSATSNIFSSAEAQASSLLRPKGRCWAHSKNDSGSAELENPLPQKLFLLSTLFTHRGSERTEESKKQGAESAEGRKRASGGAESALAQGLCAERSGVGQRMNRQRSGGCGAGAPSSAKRFFFSIQHLGFHLDLQDWLGRGEFWVFLPSSAECKTRFVFCTWSRE